MTTVKKAIDQKEKNLGLHGIQITKIVIIHGDRGKKSKILLFYPILLLLKKLIYD